MEKSIWSYDGRLTIGAFWLRWLICFAISWIVSLIFGRSSYAISVIVSIAVAVFMIIQGIKRMHDVDKSGWYFLIPIYNLILALTPGTQGSNSFGENPR